MDPQNKNNLKQRILSSLKFIKKWWYITAPVAVIIVMFVLYLYGWKISSFGFGGPTFTPPTLNSQSATSTFTTSSTAQGANIPLAVHEHPVSIAILEGDGLYHTKFSVDIFFASGSDAFPQNIYFPYSMQCSLVSATNNGSIGLNGSIKKEDVFDCASSNPIQDNGSLFSFSPPPPPCEINLIGGTITDGGVGVSLPYATSSVLCASGTYIGGNKINVEVRPIGQ